MRQPLFLFLLMTSLGISAQNSATIKLYFDIDKAVLKSSERPKLDALGKQSDLKMITDINIIAYCDDNGSEEYNKQLSVQRAANVKSYLISLGLESSKIKEVNGKGELELNNLQNIEKQRTENRRAEIRLSYLPVLNKQSNDLKMQNSLLPDSLKVGDKITLQNILFIGGLPQMFPESYASLDSLVTTLKNRPEIHIIILGHVCCVPPGQDGLDQQSGRFDLSVSRAKAIYEYLIVKGIAADRLQYKGMKGDYKTGKGDKFDRRVEIEISKMD